MEAYAAHTNPARTDMHLKQHHVDYVGVYFHNVLFTNLMMNKTVLCVLAMRMTLQIRSARESGKRQ